MAAIADVIAQLQGGCIVSCQALPSEPLHGSHLMAAMAVAAEQGGAKGIRANTPEDIAAIKQACALPVIGIYKQEYPGSDVFITPTVREAAQVAEAGADVIALDATQRPRPHGEQLADVIAMLRSRYPHVGIMADVATFEEGKAAMALGADLVSTTLSGYTAYSTNQDGPDVTLLAQLAALSDVPVIAEGRIWTIEDCKQCMEAGAYAVVIGTAITRPQEITKRFVRAMQDD